MKKIMTAILVFLGITMGFAQETELTDSTGDNFSLEGALALLKKSNSLEEFEKLINDERNNVNNLDLNNDGIVDYITVDDIIESNTHVIVVSTYLDKNEKQDIATIGIEQTGDEVAILQIEGDTDLYPENTIVEPYETQEVLNAVKRGPAMPDVSTYDATVNVWFWPSIRLMYAPTYVAWVSPYRWSAYPKYWRSWKPYRHTVFYNRAAAHRVYCRPVSVRRVAVARKIYLPKRKHSAIVVHTTQKTVVVNAKTAKKIKAKKVSKRKKR